MKALATVLEQRQTRTKVGDAKPRVSRHDIHDLIAGLLKCFFYCFFYCPKWRGTYGCTHKFEVLVHELKKHYPLHITILLFSLNQTSIAYAEFDKSSGIVRSIITKIEWSNDQNIIKIHSILLKKFPNQPIVIVNDFITPVIVGGIEGPLTNEEARDFVHETFPLKADHIFNKKVKVFKDFSDRVDVPQAEIDHAVQELKKQIEIDWNNPNSHNVTKPSSWLESLSLLKVLLFIGMVILVVLFYFKIKSKETRIK